ncbi:hypothetical protein LH464_05320 [Neorhizobium sp. T786]|uniref:hypothetical protein n=1 Tax=Pseudorhizobium xiangyangii TaxID=2883104 RepID=UPI001CFFFCCC|nr:hypothetical protein [Neorhizobium xiangyangii]MCB5201898.1 hypothetical protein [Neorhizobium xiangyangii]
MAIPKPSNSRIVVRHRENGKSILLIDGKSVPGLMGFEVVQAAGNRSELRLTVIGLGYRVEQEEADQIEAV